MLKLTWGEKDKVVLDISKRTLMTKNSVDDQTVPKGT